MLTSFAVFAALLAMIAALSFAGKRSARSYAISEAFAEAARRCGLSLAPSRMAAVGKLHGIDLRAELVQSREPARLAMRCVATLLPALGLGLAVRTADDRDAAALASPSDLEVPVRPELTALALHPDLADSLLAGPVGDVLCKMAEVVFEPRLRDATAETWVVEPADEDRLFVAMNATAELARLAVQERRKLPVAKRVRALETALVDAAEELDMPVRRAGSGFEVQLEHGSIQVRLERDGARAITVFDLAVDRPFPSGADGYLLTGLRGIAGVRSARVTEVGSVVVELGHASHDSSELRPVLADLSELASGRSRRRRPYR